MHTNLIIATSYLKLTGNTKIPSKTPIYRKKLRYLSFGFVNYRITKMTRIRRYTW